MIGEYQKGKSRYHKIETREYKAIKLRDVYRKKELVEMRENIAELILTTELKKIDYFLEKEGNRILLRKSSNNFLCRI